MSIPDAVKAAANRLGDVLTEFGEHEARRLAAMKQPAHVVAERLKELNDERVDLNVRLRLRAADLVRLIKAQQPPTYGPWMLMQPCPVCGQRACHPHGDGCEHCLNGVET